MNKKNKFAAAIATTVLVGTLTVGAVASAAGSSGRDGADNGARRQGMPHLTTQQKCDKQSEIATRVTTTKQRIEQRIATLQAKKAKADAAGNSERSAHIQQRIERLQKAQTRIDAKYAKFQTWVQTNCPAA